MDEEHDKLARLIAQLDQFDNTRDRLTSLRFFIEGHQLLDTDPTMTVVANAIKRIIELDDEERSE